MYPRLMRSIVAKNVRGMGHQHLRNTAIKGHLAIGVFRSTVTQRRSRNH